MSGGVPYAIPMVEPFGANAVPANINYPIPTPTQLPANPGRASLNDGFPPANFLSIAAGGVPVDGADMQGILYWLSLYLVALQAGQLPLYDATFAASISGYQIGATLGKLSGVGLWTNLVAGNTSDPDTGGAGWLDGVPAGAGYLDDVLTAGTHNNLAPSGFGPAVAFLDIDVSAGNVTVTGLAGGSDGQTVTITPINHASNTLTLTSLDVLSSAANRFRLSTSVILTQYVPQTLRYSATLGLWVPIS
jgi:hypothetical protein